MALETNLERELKFDVDPAFDPPDLRSVVGRTVRLPARQMSAVYYDTADFRLWDRGITLRYRTEKEGDVGQAEGKWTLKLPVDPPAGEQGSAAGTESVRSELSWKAGGSAVPPEVLEIVAGVVRRAPLQPVVELKSERRRLLLQEPDAEEAWAEVDDDLVTVAGGPRDGMRFRQLEVELLESGGAAVGDGRGHPDLRTVESELTRAGARPSTASKFGLATGLHPLPALNSTTKGRSRSRRRTSVPDLVAQTLGEGFGRILDADVWLRSAPAANPGVEVIHQARVGLRRLRACLTFLRPVLDPVWAAHTEEPFRELGQLLGAVRDADVLLERLAANADRDADSIERLAGLVAAERHLAAEELDAYIRQPEWLDALDRVHAAIERPPLVIGSKGQKAGDMAAASLARRWKKVERKISGAPRRPGVDDLHRIRIRSKKLRYVAELAAPVVGKPAALLAARAEEVQKLLGRVQDATRAAHQLAELATHPSISPAVAFAAGRLAAEAEAEADRHRRKWPAAAALLNQPEKRKQLKRR